MPSYERNNRRCKKEAVKAEKAKNKAALLRIKELEKMVKKFTGTA